MTTQIEVQEKNGQRTLVDKAGNVLAVVAAPLVLAAPAMADVPTAPDVSNVVTYIGYAVAAITAIGVAKMIPAAAMWLYSSLTGMVKRG